MSVSFRTLLVLALGGFGLILSVLAFSNTADIGVVGATDQDAPPLHAPVPTEPFVSHS